MDYLQNFYPVAIVNEVRSCLLCILGGVGGICKKNYYFCITKNKRKIRYAPL